MSSFKQRLSELLSSEYENKDIINDQYGYLTERSKKLALPQKSHQSNNMPSRDPPTKLTSAIMNKSNSKKNNEVTILTTTSQPREYNTLAVTQKRKRSMDLLNTSNLSSSSRYTERLSFSPHLNQFNQYREQSRNKRQSRINKKIADLSKDFKRVIHQRYLNRPISSLKTIESNNGFNINFISLAKIMNSHPNTKRISNPLTTPINLNYNQDPFLKSIPIEKQKHNHKGDISSYASTFRAKNKESNSLKQLYDLLGKNKITY